MRDGDANADQAVLSVGVRAPRFALVEPGARPLAMRLASVGWYPLASATAIRRLRPEDLADSEALVVCCTERLLLSSGFQADLARLSGALPRVAVVAADGPETAAYAARIGWTGFTTADSPASEIARTIAKAARRELAFPANTLSGLLRALARVAPVTPLSAAALTPRQRQIVTLIAQGAPATEIALLLRISPATATKHVQNARRRLSARTRGQLVAAMGTGGVTAVDRHAS